MSNIRPWLTMLAAATITGWLQLPASATIVVGIQTPDAFALAADSRRTVFSETPLYKEACKLFHIKGVPFAVGGLHWFPRTALDVEVTVANILWRRNSIQQAVHRIESQVAIALQAALRAEQLNNPASFGRVMQSLPDHGVTTVLLGGVETGKIVTALIGFSIEERTTGLIVKSARQACATESCRLILGGHATIDRYLAQAGAYIPRSPDALARLLVQKELDAGSADVGPPIDVVSVTRDGVRWLARKPNCTGLPEGFKPPVD